jgi:predicted CXXCH cytochrome family protein
MELLLRRTLGGSGQETVDHELSGDPLLLGSDGRCNFLLPGLPGTIELTAAGGGTLDLKSDALPLERGGKGTDRLRLAPGEECACAGLRLRVFAPPGGFDTALEVRGEVRAATRRHRPTPPPAPWPMRRLAWLLVLAVLLITLALPLAGTQGFFGETLPPGLPTDALWSSGPLSAAHRTAGLGKDCAACHSEPFRMVEDSTCMDCHSTIHEHAPVEEFPALALAEARCAACHREHNEPPRMVRRDPPLCTACHAEPEGWRRAGSGTPLPVHAFSEQGHPAFRLATWRPQGQGAALGWERIRSRLAPSELREQSGLKFDHAVHLDPEKVRRRDDDGALACASCHEDAGDGEHFMPVTMDRHCRACHSLNFDPFDPAIELPHGSTRAAFEAMEAHFIREFTDPVLRAERAREQPRRLPGKRMGAASCSGDGLSCGREEAVKEAAYQFADSGCVTCHEVVDTGAQAAIDRWFVHPVKLTADWYPESRFDHRAHLNLPGRSGDRACALCHDASRSEAAGDVLIPARSNCLDCHDSRRAEAAVDCVSCHSFHRAAGSLAGETRTATAEG